MCFPWESQEEIQELRELSLHLEERPASFTVGRFTGGREGQTVCFSHPLTGKEHTLTVIERERQELQKTALEREDYEYPRSYMAMLYTVTPELRREAIHIRDCSPGDKARKHTADGMMAVLASAVGPVMRMGKEHEPRTAISSLYYKLPGELEWRIVLREKLLEDIEITLFP